MDGYLDNDRLDYLSEEEREYYEYICNYGSEDEIEEAKEYFG